MQNQLVTAQQELADATVQGSAGGGLVKAIVNGQGELVDITIEAAAIDPADPAESALNLADMVLAACRDAYRGAAELQQELMGPFAAGFGDAGDEELGEDEYDDEDEDEEDGEPGFAGFPGLPGLTGLTGLPGRPGLPGGTTPPAPGAPPAAAVPPAAVPPPGEDDAGRPGGT